MTRMIADLKAHVAIAVRKNYYPPKIPSPSNEKRQSIPIAEKWQSEQTKMTNGRVAGTNANENENAN